MPPWPGPAPPPAHRRRAARSSPRSTSSGRTCRRRRCTRASQASPLSMAASGCGSMACRRLTVLPVCAATSSRAARGNSGSQLVQRAAGAELHGEVAPVPPIPQHPHGPDGRYRHDDVALQQLHQPALEGELRPERTVDLDHHAPVEDEHRVGVGCRRLDPVVGDPLSLADRIDGGFPHRDVVEQRRPLRPGVDRRQQEGQADPLSVFGGQGDVRERKAVAGGVDPFG